MRRPILATVLAAAMAAAPVTQTLADEHESPEELALQAFEKLQMAFDLFLGSIPLYAPPELLPNGDIIIRRIDPDDVTPEEDGDSRDDGGATDT